MKSMRKHKYWERALCPLLVFLLLLPLVACSRTAACDCPCTCGDPEGGPSVLTPAPTGQAAPGRGPGTALPGTPLVVHIMVNMLTNNMQFQDGTRVSYTLCPEEMTQVAQHMGFNLDFRLFESFTGFGGQMSGEQFMEYFHENHDAVFVLPYNWAAAHLPEDLARDITEDVKTHLPELYSDILFYGNDIDGSVFLLPTAMSAANISQPRVRVNTELYEQYGLSVETVEDLEALLRWQRDRQRSAPAVTWTTYGSMSTVMNPSVFSRNTNTHILPLDLFLPRMGYTSLKAMFAHDANIVNDLWMDREGRIAAWWEFDAAGDAFDEFMDWYQEGLIDFVRPGGVTMGHGAIVRPEEPISSYPVILGNVNYNAVDFAAMTSFGLSEPALWFPNVNSVAFVSHGADMTEFLLFIQFLLSDVNRYAAFVLGEEGRDYEWVEDQGMPRLERGNFNTARSMELSQTRGFVGTARFSQYLNPLWNTIDESNPPSYPLTRAQRREIGNMLAENEEYQAFLAEKEKYLSDYFDALYEDPRTALSFWQVMIDIRRMEGSDIAARLVNGAMGR
jgi:hypothetical protein